MKTAMQEMIEKFETSPDYYFKEWIELKKGYLLEKEKEQIVNSFVEGKLHGIDCGKQKATEFITGQQYFNQTYTNQTLKQ